MRIRETVWWVLSACLLVGCAADPPPNVLFIAVDDMNDYVSPLGGRAGVETPNLERLAGAGITFTNAHTASPACHPSRVALLTGVAPSRSGISQNHYAAKRASWRISPALKDVVSLPQFYRNNGYRVSGGGKIFHALQWSEGSENEPEAWDEYYPDALAPIPTWVLPDGFDPQKNRAEGRHPWFHWEPLDVSDEETSDFKVVDWAIDQLKRDHDKPFFLAVGIFRPHMP
jgi:arylsulfatase A-like enzyme